MFTKKSFIFCIMFFVLIHINYTQKFKKLPISELTNPSGPSYVPVPYPKTRSEIIKDIKYYFDKNRKTNYRSLSKSSTAIYVDVKNTLFLKNSKYKLGKIIFVKNYSINPSIYDKDTMEYYIDCDKYILIDILNNNNVVGRLHFKKNGLYANAVYTTENIKKKITALIIPDKNNLEQNKLLSEHTLAYTKQEHIYYSNNQNYVPIRK